MKVCCTCKESKPLEMFGKESSRPDGLKKRCKACHNQGNKEYRERNPEAAAAATANWAKSNPDKRLAKNQRWSAANPGRATELARRWQQENPDRHRANQRRYVERPAIRLHRSMRERMAKCFRGTLRTFDRLGYTRDQLMAHIERQFASGMSWQNYGDWHVDHIRPLASFTITGEDCPEFKAAWCLSNLRPLWAAENLAKRAKNLFLV